MVSSIFLSFRVLRIFADMKKTSEVLLLVFEGNLFHWRHFSCRDNQLKRGMTLFA